MLKRSDNGFSKISRVSRQTQAIVDFPHFYSHVTSQFCFIKLMSHDQPLPDPRLRSVEPKSLLYILTLSSTSHKNLAPVCYSFETRPEMVNAGDAAKPDVDASLFPFRIFIPLLLFFSHYSMTETASGVARCYCRLCEKSNGGKSTRCRDRDCQETGLGASKKDGQIRKMQVGSLCCPDRGSGFIFSCFPDAGFAI